MVGSERLLSSASKTKKNEDEVESNREVKVGTSGGLEAMTIHQLRAISKNFGISTRCSKNDLVSTLKCFLDGEEDDKISQGTSQIKQSDPESRSSTKDAKNSSEGTPSKRKVKNISSGAQAQTPTPVEKVSRVQQKKRKAKPPRDNGASLEANSKSFVVKEMVSTKTSTITVIPGTKTSKPKKKKLSQNENDDGGSADKVGFLKKSNEPWTILAHKKPQQGWIPYNPKTMRPPPLDAGTKFVKLCSWNVNGLRALLKLENFSAFAQREDFDIVCLQETKLQEKHVEKIKESLLDGYGNSFWNCSVSKLGYSGAAVISRIKPLSVKYGLGQLDHDSEGRLVTVEFDKFYLISGYVPNSGEGLRRLTYRVTQWDPSLGNYMKELEKSKPVILTGDLNCAHEEIDIYSPAANKRSAGFTIEERESFEKNFLSNGFVDTFRRQHPGVVGYTFWGFRHGGRVDNKGWRLDYFLVSESIADKVHDSYIVPDVVGSDHCPIGLILKL